MTELARRHLPDRNGITRPGETCDLVTCGIVLETVKTENMSHWSIFHKEDNTTSWFCSLQHAIESVGTK